MKRNTFHIKLLAQALVLVAVFCPLAAQQLPGFSQIVTNYFLINPSVAGSDGLTTVDLVARKDWIGFTKNTPETYALNIQGRILKSKYSIKTGLLGGSIFKPSTKGRVGLGMNLYNDRNGAINQTGLRLTYAYHIFVHQKQLSFGLSGSVFQYRIGKEDAMLKNPEADPLYGLIGKATAIPDASAGFNYLSDRYHIGFSVAQLFQSKIKVGSNAAYAPSGDIRLRRHYYFTFTHRSAKMASKSWEYEPSVIVRANEKMKFLGDASIRFFYEDDYWIGLSARSTGDAVFMGGFRYTHLYFAYSFDYGINGLTRYSKGSHEVTISAKFGDTARRYRWLDRY